MSSPELLRVVLARAAALVDLGEIGRANLYWQPTRSGQSWIGMSR